MTNLHSIFIREEVIRKIRQFFFDRQFHEVIPLILNRALPLEPNLYSFSTKWKTKNRQQMYYLPTSPELALKKMLSQGIGNCFAIGKSFRNLEGAGSQHSPEFMMLEWYREEAHYEQIMQDVQDLLKYINNNSSTLTYQDKIVHLEGQWPVFSLIDLFEKYANLDLLQILDDEIMKKKAKQKNYQTDNAGWQELYDQILVNEIEPHLPAEPFFLVDFPSRISPLCSINESDPRLAKRFELYLFNMELANGNNENTDYKTVKNSMMKESQYRQSNHLINTPIDEEFIQALKKMNQSKKNYAGIGLGVDRLAMIFANAKTLTELEPLNNLVF